MVRLLAFYQAFDPARLHLPLQNRQRTVQVPVYYPHSDPPPLLALERLVVVVVLTQ
uniref:Uncharacterized protein n=1 Tax=Rhizophora mucronata TaxID=61149 RepID=A0A2P2IQR5_RHIMU